MTSGYWRSMLEKHEHLVTFTINLCTSSWTSKFVSISHKVMKVIERPSRFWFLLGTWTWHCKLQKPLKCQQWAVIRVGWVDFFGGWLHQVENRKFYFGDDFISHLIRIPWPLKPTRMTHGLNVISLLPWDWVSGSVLKHHGFWLHAVKVETSPDGSVSPEECGVRASYGSRFVVWFGCGTLPVTLAKRRFIGPPTKHS